MLPDKLIIPNGAELLRVPAGKFIMGSDQNEDREKPQHTVDIPYDYWVGRFTVTNEQYNQFMKTDYKEGRENHPVVKVLWRDAQNYANWLNEKFSPQIPQGFIFRLPSEAEWEKAARGEKGLIYPWGDEFDDTKSNTWESQKRITTAVGSYSPQGDSPYGCADMSGNVWEWTHSAWKEYPYNIEDGREDETDLSFTRVIRGGSFSYVRGFARCASRLADDPDFAWYLRGFRLVYAPPFNARM